MTSLTDAAIDGVPKIGTESDKRARIGRCSLYIDWLCGGIRAGSLAASTSFISASFFHSGTGVAVPFLGTYIDRSTS